jgi:hypothetical protein
MAAPKFRPVDAIDRSRAYTSPDHVPASWQPDRPGEIEGFQPDGDRLGTPGPDQGFALRIARRLVPELHLQEGEHADDVVRGCLGVGLRRASMFSRAPVVHDLRIAFTIWGLFDPDPPAELVALRRELFEGLRHVGHHYTEARVVADMPPADVLRLTPAEIEERYPAEWPALLGR